MSFGFELDGNIYEIDDDGFLQDLDDWSEEVAEYLAYLDDVVLSDAHWEVIRIVRDCYREHGISPEVNLLLKEMGSRLGQGKGQGAYLLMLFPGGAVQASRIAGTPRPVGCI
ncbi:MAG TPA: TusE/DsrC/DsvC family sulfur relay protein [Anaerolineae bacterium]|jgi:tRNA 2-thiouridine synthesizing protein E|nr:TusE/DsrC/DsvC family sulfur relay protein [Anaerolineae bacterium]